MKNSWVAVAIIVAIIISGGAGYSFSSGKIPTTSLRTTITYPTTQTTIKVSTLTTSVTNTSQVQDLQEQIGNLMNSSALQQWELRTLEKTENVGVEPLYINQTWTVPSDSNLTTSRQIPESNNGILYFSATSCPNSGTSGNFANGYYQLIVLLSNTGGGMSSNYGPIPTNASTYSLVLTNNGNQSVTCTASLAFVYSTK